MAGTLEIVKVNNLNSAYIRPLVFLGDGEMGLLPGNVPVRVAIAAWEWGGLIGFILGKKEIEKIMGRPLSNRYNIHRTRKGFDNDGIDTFDKMALKGITIVNKVVLMKMGGFTDKENDRWILPNNK